jgi:putative SOS response-associated peptidase YedK
MKGIILLNYNEDTRQVEDEEKARFLRDFLERCFDNAPEVAEQIATIWNVDGPLSAPQKVKLRNILTTYNISVIDDHDGHMKVFLENEPVAEWLKPSYKLKKELQIKDPKKRIFLEMEVNCWSVFDPPETEQETE